MIMVVVMVMVMVMVMLLTLRLPFTLSRTDDGILVRRAAAGQKNSSFSSYFLLSFLMMASWSEEPLQVKSFLLHYHSALQKAKSRTNFF